MWGYFMEEAMLAQWKGYEFSRGMSHTTIGLNLKCMGICMRRMKR
jgi:hypothetical protein